MSARCRELVTEAMDAVFGRKDASAVARYFGPTYIQHNAKVPDGVIGLEWIVRNLAEKADFSVAIHRVIADRDLVAVHATYQGFGPTPLIAFDLFRVEGDRIVEHWDGLADRAPPNPSGRTQTDGAAAVADQDKTEVNRTIVTAFVTDVLLGGQYERLPEFISTAVYHQHNSAIADGLDGLGSAIEALARQGIRMEYFKLHRVVAEGNFVLTQSEGAFAGEPTAYYDLFRLESGKIVEHWDVMQPIVPAAEAEHVNGPF